MPANATATFKITRRNLVAALAVSAPALAVSADAAPALDAELLALGREYDAAVAAGWPAFSEVDRLSERADQARAEWLDADRAAQMAHALGFSAPSRDDLFNHHCRVCDDMGWSAAQRAEAEAHDRLDDIAQRIRAAPAAVTPAGFLVKLKGLSHELGMADHFRPCDRTKFIDGVFREVFQQAAAIVEG